MSPAHRFALLALVAWLAFPVRGRADWLEVFPTCAMGDAPRRSGPSDLLYPRPGLPAFAHPGEDLVMRVRVPTPLTPPPGVQQERALAGWFVELEGSGTFAVEGARHHYRLRVADVRPDAHTTLVYRATVRLPPWIAPGTYDIRMRSPGSREVRAGAVLRVGEPGQPPKLARLRARPTPTAAATLALLDVDIWLLDPRDQDSDPDSDSDSDPGSLPWLDLSGTLAVRVGEDLLVTGGCDDPHVPFAVAVGRAGGDRAEPPAAPAEHHLRLAGADADRPLPTGALEALAGGGWINRSGMPLQVRVVFPEGERGLALDGASERLGFWPGTPVRPVGHRASVVGRWRVAPGARVVPRRLEPAPPTLEVTIREEPTTHRPTPVRVQSSGRVALAWEEDGTAFVESPGTHQVPVRFRWLEHHEVHALALGPRGAARRTASATVVETLRPSGCAAAGGRSHPLLLLLGWLLFRGRRARSASFANAGGRAKRTGRE